MLSSTMNMARVHEPRVADIRELPGRMNTYEIAAAHFNDGAEAAIEGTAA
jgi:hypothetical protein